MKYSTYLKILRILIAVLKCRMHIVLQIILKYILYINTTMNLSQIVHNETKHTHNNSQIIIGKW